MNRWILPCNLKYYDVFNAFQELKTLDWKQRSRSVSIGDLVYIYVGAPYSAIMFECQVIKVNLDKCEIDDSKFVLKNNNNFESFERHMKIQLIRSFNEKRLSMDVMQKCGEKGKIMGARKMSIGLCEYINKLSFEKDTRN